MSINRQLHIAPPTVEAFMDVLRPLWAEGVKSTRLFGDNELAAALAREAEKQGIILEHGLPPDNSRAHDTLIVFTETVGELLSAQLLSCLDFTNVVVLAPVTDWHFRNRPLFLISIPKAGTHLLYKLAEAFGYGPGIEFSDYPSPGHWYCIEYSNSHTSAGDFFIDTVRRSKFGNRHHPFMRSPAVFIYRNPLDILVSEANYYHLDGKTAFAGYLSSLSFPERLLRLTNDPWLLGSIRDRVGNFAAWLDFPNVAPVSFEELVGADGGGDTGIQENVIWSLQLKLQVPGDPADYGRKVFSRDSQTFHEGQIGGYRKVITDEAYRIFKKLPQDFMTTFGYDGATLERLVFPPKRAEEFRRRPLRVSAVDFACMALTVEPAYFGCNLVRFNGRFYAVPVSLGLVHIARLPETALSLLPQADRLLDLKHSLALGGAAVGLIHDWIDNELAPAVAHAMQEGAANQPQGSMLSAHVLERLKTRADPAKSALMADYRGYNLVLFRGRYYAINISLGEVDLTADDTLLEQYGSTDIVIADSLDQVKAKLDLQALSSKVNELCARLDLVRGGPTGESDLPALVGNYHGFNLLAYAGQVWAVEMAAGPVDFADAKVLERLLAEGQLMRAATVDGARAAVDRLLDRRAFDAGMANLGSRLEERLAALDSRLGKGLEVAANRTDERLAEMETRMEQHQASLAQRVSLIAPESDGEARLLEENYRGFNLLAYAGQVWAVEMAAGLVDFTDAAVIEHLLAEGQLMRTATVDGARGAVARLLDRRAFDAGIMSNLGSRLEERLAALDTRLEQGLAVAATRTDERLAEMETRMNQRQESLAQLDEERFVALERPWWRRLAGMGHKKNRGMK